MDERLERGAARAEHLSPGFEQNLREKIGAVAPDFVRYTLEYPFGDVYSRPRLDIRARQIATVSALVTLGTIDQLRIHLRICLEIGISHEEIAEVLIQLSVYAGWPRALSAMTVAGEVFAEGESKS